MINARKCGKTKGAHIAVPLASVLGIASSVAFANASFYANDFETRTSAAPVPALGVWQTAQPYPTSSGIIACCPDEGADYTSLATFFNGNAGASVGRPSIDGWFVPYINNLYKLQPRYQYPFSGSLTENPALRDGRSGSRSSRDRSQRRSTSLRSDGGRCARAGRTQRLFCRMRRRCTKRRCCRWRRDTA